MSHGPTGRHDIVRKSLSIGDELALFLCDVYPPSALAGQERRRCKSGMCTHNRPRRTSETPFPAPVRLYAVGEVPCGQAGVSSRHRGTARHNLLGADMTDDRLSLVDPGEVGAVHHG
jgi:hypothetical protein